MIRLENVSYDMPRGAVHGLSFHLAAGETAVIHGPHGSGKTTFAEVCVGTLPIESGAAYLLGKKLEFMPHQYREELVREIGIVSRHATLMDNQTIAGNVGLPVSYHLGLEAEEVRQRVFPVLEQFGIRDLAGKFPHEITDTEAKLAMMARAAVFGPRLLVMDEPTGGDLDPGGFIRIMDAINALRQGRTVLITTSSPSLATLKGASVYYLIEGNLFRHGKEYPAASRAAEDFFRQIRNYTERQYREIGDFYRGTIQGGGL
ncbi:MAG: ATP-binding cassette domain-containing protein [Nitrospinae bacterium]|nr:ATP-binding cassette domain-containing protein [Nitrospinota bacterium]